MCATTSRPTMGTPPSSGQGQGGAGRGSTHHRRPEVCARQHHALRWGRLLPQRAHPAHPGALGQSAGGWGAVWMWVRMLGWVWAAVVEAAHELASAMHVCAVALPAQPGSRPASRPCSPFTHSLFCASFPAPRFPPRPRRTCARRSCRRASWVWTHLCPPPSPPSRPATSTRRRRWAGGRGWEPGWLDGWMGWQCWLRD